MIRPAPGVAQAVWSAAWAEGTERSDEAIVEMLSHIPDAPARPVITFDWYRKFSAVPHRASSAGWFSYVIVFGELAVDRFLLPLLGTPWKQVGQVRLKVP